MSELIVLVVVVVVLVIIIIAALSFTTPTTKRLPLPPSDPPLSPSPIYDVLIVGGGITGIYLASQLLQQNPTLRLLVLEEKEQVGGRLLSYPLPRPGLSINFYGEMGGMRYFPDTHRRVAALVKQLGLPTFTFPVRITSGDEDIAAATAAVAAPYTRQQIQYNEVLYNQGFFNSIYPMIVEEDLRSYARNVGYNFLEDLLSFPMGGENFLNFRETVQTQLTDGYQSLVTTLQERYNVPVQYGVTIVDSQCVGKGEELVYGKRTRDQRKSVLGEDEGDTQTLVYNAKKVYYCVSLYSLEALGLVESSFVRQTFCNFQATKFIVKIRNPWWSSSQFGQHVTHNPLRQVWFWNEEWLLIYADQEDARFWSIYFPSPGTLTTFRGKRRRAPPSVQGGGGVLAVISRLLGQCLVDGKLVEDRALARAKERIDEECIGDVTRPPLPLVEIVECHGIFWPDAAFFWQPTPVLRAIQEDFVRRNILTGDLSNFPGWVEGALEIVDVALGKESWTTPAPPVTN